MSGSPSAAAAATAGSAGAPPHAPGERFHCRIDVENVCISVEGDATSSTTTLFWEEARVACKFNGVTQRTRWMALQPAMEEAKKELQTAAGDDVTGVAAPQTGGLLALPYTAFNNLSYEVEFTAEAPADPAVTAVRTVKPKRFHLMELEVEAQNLHRVYSAVGGQTGDRAPTSGNMEVISASLNKKAAKVSAWTRSVFSRLGGSGEKKDEPSSRYTHHHSRGSSKEQNEAAMAGLTDHTVSSSPAPALDDTTVREGVYQTVMKHIDVSEAYNRPSGRQVYCLVVKPESRKLPESGVGTPITISFAIVAHYGYTASVPRSFHNFAVVIDQFVLDYSEAARVLPPNSKDEAEQPRPITGYAFGYTANTAKNPYALEVVSKPVPVVTAATAAGDNGEGAVRVIDFDRLHSEGDERKRTPEDYRALPTSCVVVSGSMGSQPTNQPRLGNRVVLVSRFKTSPDGLCKPSFKCQFVVSLVRFYGDDGASAREAAAPINLAALMNEEMVPQRIRAVKFELGEVMYLRLRRFSFAEPEVLRAPLLLPYDYDNSNVQLPAPPPTSQQSLPPQEQQQAPPQSTASTVNDRAAAVATQPPAPPPSAAQATDAAASPSKDNNSSDEAHPAAPPAPAGYPAVSFDSSSSSSSSSQPVSPRGQRSGSDGDASAPRVNVQRESTAPFFTLEPQDDTHALLFGNSGNSTAVAGTTSAEHTSAFVNPAAPSYDPLVAAATEWGGHTPAAEHHTAAVMELTPTASNPFFSADPPAQQQQRQADANMAGRVVGNAREPSNRNMNPYNFGTADGEGESAENTRKSTANAGFELTPFE